MTMAVPNWAQGLVCRFNLRCKDGECEQLHIVENPLCISPPNPKLVVCAGPQRSGSTWLFNALRLLLEGTNERVHSYWLHEITTDKLNERGYGKQLNDPANILIKTHEWSDKWDPSTADLIILTERDLCGVINSYLRAGWRPYDFEYLKSYVGGYMCSHNKWKAVAHAVVPYEHLADVGKKEIEAINELQDLLKFKDKLDSNSISRAIESLPVPSVGGPDALTKLWPRHIGSKDNSLAMRPKLSAEECEVLRGLVF